MLIAVSNASVKTQSKFPVFVRGTDLEESDDDDLIRLDKRLALDGVEQQLGRGPGLLLQPVHDVSRHATT